MRRAGGAEAFTVWLARELAVRGEEVHVVCHDVAAQVNKYRQATQRASHDADRSHQALVPRKKREHHGMHIHRMTGDAVEFGIWVSDCLGGGRGGGVKRIEPDVVHSMTVAYPGGGGG